MQRNKEISKTSLAAFMIDDCKVGGWLTFDFCRRRQEAAAPRFAIFEAWAPRTIVLGDFPYLHFRLLEFIHQHHAPFSLRIVAESAPVPLPRFQRQSALHCFATESKQVPRQ